MPDPAWRRPWCAAAVSWSLVSAPRRRRRRHAHRRSRQSRAGGWVYRAGSGRRRLYRLLTRFGKLNRPGALFAGIDLEEAGAVVAARQAIADAADREFLVAGAHIGLPHPFAAAIVIDRVEIIVSRHKIALEHRFARPCRQVPPAFRRPALPILVADGDADAARRIVAQPEIGRGGFDGQ